MSRKQLESEYQLSICLEKKVRRRTFRDQVLSSKQYQIMVTWILEHLDSLKAHNSTKYLAKTYLDLFLCEQSSLSPEDLHLIAITVIRVAVKFNQSGQYPISFAQKMGSYRYQSEDFQRMEVVILTTLDFNLNYLTPYHYIPIVSSLISVSEEVIKQIDAVIDFSCTLKQLIHLSAGEMFLAALLYLTYCYDPEQIEKVKTYSSTFENLSEVVLLLDQKASESDEKDGSN